MSGNRISVWLLASLLLAGPGVIRAASANSDGIGKPIYGVQPVQKLLADGRSGINTVPTWSNHFIYKASGVKKVFPYTMVGSSPWAGSATTVVPVQIVPIALIFSNGVALDGTSRIGTTVSSPIFKPFQSQTGFTQFGDAIQRASFFSVVQSRNPNWHVLLGQPSVWSTHTITVPADAGFEFTGSNSGSAIGLLDMDWFGKQLDLLIKAVNPDPHSLTIFLTYNSFLFAENPGRCCVVGFHSAVATPGPGNSQDIHTFVWATHNDPHIFSAPLEDITALSHEIAEWYNDPLVSNVVPGWMQPGSSACFSNILEVGDPLEIFPNLSFQINLDGSEYHPQDVTLFSWFARQSPSIGLQGRYSYRGDKLKAPAPVCNEDPSAVTFHRKKAQSEPVK